MHRSDSLERSDQEIRMPRGGVAKEKKQALRYSVWVTSG